MQIQEPYSQWTLNTYRERQKTLCTLGEGEAGISLNWSRKGLIHTLGKAISHYRLFRLSIETGETSLFEDLNIELAASDRLGHNLFWQGSFI